jgi:hypothetical protein
VIRLLVRRGLLADGHDNEVDATDPLQDDEPLLAACYQASVGGRVATGERAGAWVRRQGRPDRRRTGKAVRKGELCCRIDGFDLNANVRVKRHRRADLERLCRYMLRPPIATDRLYWRSPERKEVVVELRRKWSDGTTALLLTPMELIEKLVPLIPASKANQVRYHGVLAPGSSWRSAIVGTLANKSDKPVADGTESLDDAVPTLLRPRRLGWAQLLMRVLDIDVLTCRRCASKRRIIAFIQQTAAARQILQHLGLPHQPPPIAPARPPPQQVFGFP